MNFKLTEEQRMMVDAATRLGEQYGVDYWDKKDRSKAFPSELWQAICDSGFAGVALPEQYGGADLGMVEMALIIEALAAGGGGSTLGQLFMINPIFGGVSIARFGSDEMKAELLPALCSGKMSFCMALTEPDAGTNSLALRTFARPDGEGWRLKGRKIWITGVDAAHKMLVVARTRRLEECAKPSEGISLFLIDVDRDGLSHTPIEKMGTNTLSSSSVFFDDVYVAPHELLGEKEKGWRQLLQVLNNERIVTTAGMVGAGSLGIRLAVQYANERKVFGAQPISSYQGLQFPLAQSYAELQSARLMNLCAASRSDTGESYGSEANIAKLLGAQATIHALERSMQTMGGMGYSREYHVERLLRDARLFKIAPVSEEMILNFVATHNLGMPKGY